MNERKIIKLELARKVLSGEISIQEAMEKAQIRDRRTIIRWVKSVSINPVKGLKDSKNDDLNCSYRKMETPTIESELNELKARNRELLRFQNVLTNRINDLEILINYAERKYKISIMRILEKTKQ